MALHEWTVAGGLIETEAGVLLVRNVRRGGFEDWSTPGGVIDAQDVDLLLRLRDFSPEAVLGRLQGPPVAADAEDGCQVHDAEQPAEVE